MNPKSLLIPIAAFALSATGVSAFNPQVLERAGLSRTQISAFGEARNLRQEGDTEAARDVLVQAGVDLEVLDRVREVMQQHKHRAHHKLSQAVKEKDYQKFVAATADSPLREVVTSEADFKLFVEAWELREAGELKAARALFADLGLSAPQQQHLLRRHHKN